MAMAAANAPVVRKTQALLGGDYVPYDEVQAYEGSRVGALASYAGEGHGMGGWSAKTQADALARVRDFLRVHLKPWDFTDNPHGDLTAY